MPAELKDSLDQQTFDKSRLYQIDRSTFGFYSGVYSQCEITVSTITYTFNITGKTFSDTNINNSQYRYQRNFFPVYVTEVFGELRSLNTGVCACSACSFEV